METLLTHRTPVKLVTVDGLPIDAFGFDTHHGVNQPIGTARVTIPAPIPSTVTLNAPLAIQAGWLGSGTLPIFAGTITDIERGFDENGATATLRGTGKAAQLAFPNERDLVWRGETFLRDIFLALCRRRRIRQYRADHVTYPDGSPNVKLGGNRFVDGGDVILRKRTAPHAWLAQKAALFGYRLFETPAGPVVLQRISGKPPVPGDLPFSEGLSFYDIGRSESNTSMVTWWTVLGARYTGEDGVQVQVRSSPRSVPPSPELDPPGYRADELSDAALVTQEQADGVRNVLEIDRSEPYEIESWTVPGSPELQPGDIVRLGSPSVGIGPSSRRWLIGVHHTFADEGFYSTLDGWAGSGRALPAANDCTVLNIGDGPWHLGDESIDWYRVRDPLGRVLSRTFDVPEEYTSLTLRFRAHGCNSFVVDGKLLDSRASSVEVWQGGARIGSSTLPVLGEYYNSRYDYTDDRYWHDCVVPLPGSLERGRAELRIVAGVEKRDTPGAIDDFEVKTLRLTVCGIGRPSLPVEGR